MVHPPPDVDARMALWQLFERLADCDGLVAVWDARVHEPLLPLYLAHLSCRPFEVRILHPPVGYPFLDGPWTGVSSEQLANVAQIPQPHRRLTPAEQTRLGYDLDDPRGITLRP